MPNATPGPTPVEPRLRAALGELERRLDSGSLSGVEELRETFPDVWADADAALELAYAEYVGRTRRGARPPRDDWYRRFPDLRDRLERLFAIYDLAAAALPGETDPSPLDTTPHQGPEPGPLPHPDGYEILELIGRGGMGVVYKARQLVPNRIVALKMLRGGAFAQPEDADRIRREAEAVGRLRHPNIVQIHAVGEADGVPFLCLEYVAGGSLEDALARVQRPGRPGVAPADAAQLVETLARAMQAAHEQGVVHRDLKPSNVLLASAECGVRNAEFNPNSAFRTPHSALKVTDFGLATIAEAPGIVTRTGAVVGTPCYMAPEQAAADRSAVGPRTDVYALGGILYQLLTGRPPFEGATVLETVALVRTTDPVLPRRLRPGLPRDLETICLTCLRKEPARRYATAAALADDLGRFVRGEPVRARPVSAVERGVKWARRRPAVVAFAIALAGLVATSFGLVWAKYEGAEAAHRVEQKQRIDLERSLAAERLSLAQAHWRGNEPAAARAALAEVPEAHRGAEWAALRAECHAEVDSVRIPNAQYGRFLPAPDRGRVALFSSQGATVFVVDAATGDTVETVPLQAFPAGIAYAPDGRLLVTPNVTPPARQAYQAAYQRPPTEQVTAWDFGKQESTDLWKVPAGSPVLLNSTGTRAVGFIGTRAWVADARTGSLVAQLAGPDPIRAVIPDARGRRLAAFVKSAIHLWDVEGRRIRHTIQFSNDTAQGSFSPDGDLFVWLTVIRTPGQPAAAPEYLLAGYDLAARRELYRLPLAVARGRVTFSPDGSVFAFEDMASLQLYDARTGDRRATLRGHTGFVLSTAFSRDGTRLYSVGIDYLLKTWDVTPWVGNPDRVSDESP